MATPQLPTTFPTPLEHYLAVTSGVAAQYAHTDTDTIKANLEAVVDAHNERASDNLKALTKSVTQGEWLALTRLLDRSRAEIGADGNLTLLALAYVAEKRRTGRASLELLLELTDEELLVRHDFVNTPEDDELADIIATELATIAPADPDAMTFAEAVAGGPVVPTPAQAGYEPERQVPAGAGRVAP